MIEIYNCLNNKLLFWLIVAICITFSFSSRWRRIVYFVVGEYVSCIFGLYYSSRLMSSSFKERCYRFHCHFGIWKWYKPSVKTNYYISVVMIFTQIIMQSYITINCETHLTTNILVYICIKFKYLYQILVEWSTNTLQLFWSFQHFSWVVNFALCLHRKYTLLF